MIARIWHGVTSATGADQYESMLRDDVLPGIGRVRGYRGAWLLRRSLNERETQFVTITLFDSMDDVRAFAGPDVEKAVIHEQAGKLLLRFDARSVHYQTVIAPPIE